MRLDALAPRLHQLRRLTRPQVVLCHPDDLAVVEAALAKLDPAIAVRAQTSSFLSAGTAVLTVDLLEPVTWSPTWSS